MRFDLRLLALLLSLAGIAVLLAAFGFQHLGGLDPCVLCVYQRWPWVAAIVLGALAFGLGGHRGLLALAALALAVGAGIAAFHVGVEQHWWAGTSECGGTVGAATTVEELKRQLLATPVTRCDEIAWSLFGISMAGYNFLLSAGLAIGVGGALVRNRRRMA
ncbi:MAG: disulfide bond formation protein B [Alphaproteobacteria bacterium]|nr:disulfide bond formation protein B [Alphaproteobacteria bacterium]MCB9930622.1 disulfide bond formation protein B [Alphaproteobacteria bacterium]